LPSCLKNILMQKLSEAFCLTAKTTKSEYEKALAQYAIRENYKDEIKFIFQFQGT
jgi:type II secretory ATPase GspE/PulE/Tfp pilus assembly ATPase PilB-like protein